MKKNLLLTALIFPILSISCQSADKTVPISNQLSVFSQEDTQTILQYRSIYNQINNIISSNYSTENILEAQKLLSEIKNYVLRPYAEYQILRANKLTSLDEILQFEQHNPQFPLIDKLKKTWLAQQQENQNWQVIIDHEQYLPNDTTSQCIVFQAKIENGSLSQSSEHLSKQLQQLWLTGNNLPKSCDPILAYGKNTGKITQELIRKRAILAIAKKNTALLQRLHQQANDLQLKYWLQNVVKLLQHPQNLIQQDNPFYIDKLTAKIEDQQILIAILPAFINTLKTDDVSVINQFEQLLRKIKLQIKIDDKKIRAWKIRFISHLFDSDIQEIQQWRDHIITRLQEDNLIERRIRLAIREKTPIAKWLKMLSKQTKQKDEWLYWQAKLLQQEGKNNQSNAIFKSLQQNLGFYPMLAARELGISYRPIMLEFTKNSEHNIKVYNSHLALISELRYFNQITEANYEWKKILQSANFKQKLALAHYAAQQHWYDLQVEATIQAKSWSYISLRLPNAYLDLFKSFLKDKKIDRTFAMAIARQESAWQTHSRSPANARGLMQLLPTTAKQTAKKFNLPYYHISQLFDPFYNIMIGTAHLQELFNKFGNNRILIAAAYNAGSHRVENWLTRSNGKLTVAEFIASIPFYETRGYVQNVLTYNYYYQILQGQPAQILSQEEYNRLY